MTQNAQSLSVRGPDGRPLTLSDLPKPGITRWVTRRKAEVVAAVSGGLLTEEEALRRYDLSEEEFSGWRALYSKSWSQRPADNALAAISLRPSATRQKSLIHDRGLS